MSLSPPKVRQFLLAARICLIGIATLLLAGTFLLVIRERTWLSRPEPKERRETFARTEIGAALLQYQQPKDRARASAFMLGDIGTQLLPLPVLRVLPTLFPDQFGPGETWIDRFGFIRVENNDGLPLGFTVTQRRPQSGSPSPLPFVGFSCVLCHSTQISHSVNGHPAVVPGPGSASLNLFAWLDCVQRAALDDEKFSMKTIVAAYAQQSGHPALTLEQRLMLRVWLTGFRKKLKTDLTKYDEPFGGPQALTPEGVPTGPSRTQPFRTVVRRAMLRPGTSMAVYTKVATVYHEDWRAWSQFDGSIHDLYARSAMAAFAAGATVDNLRIPEIVSNVREATDFTKQLAGPRFTEFFPDHALNAAQVERGRRIYMEVGPQGDPTGAGKQITLSCATCHGYPKDDGSWTVGALQEQVMPYEFIKTDPERVTFRYFDKIPDRLYEFFPQGHPFHFKREDLRPGPAGRVQGYVNSPIDSVWSRAPYLHNASVLTLAELVNLKPRRAVVFRGREGYDPENAGWSGADRADAQHYFRLDTTLRGNSNRGHDYPWALDDPARDEQQLKDLLVYLKSL